MRVRTVLAALTLVTVAALSGCGGDDGSSSSATTLTKQQATEALLSLDDLGDGFKVAEDDDDDDSSMGCLDDFEGIDDVVGEPTVEAEADYEADTEISLPGVLSAVASFESDAPAKKGMSEIRKALTDCTEVEQTDDDGTQFRLTIASDDKKAGPEADDQVNLSANGTVTTQGLTVPMAVHMSIIRVANHVTMSGIVTMGEEAREDADEIAAAALARIVAVIEGDPVPKQSLDLDEVDMSQLFGSGAA